MTHLKRLDHIGPVNFDSVGNKGPTLTMWEYPTLVSIGKETLIEGYAVENKCECTMIELKLMDDEKSNKYNLFYVFFNRCDP